MGFCLTTHTFSSDLQKVEARGAKVFVGFPKAIRGLAAWAVWHDDPKTERDTRLSARGLLQKGRCQEADARDFGTVGLPGFTKRISL